MTRQVVLGLLFIAISLLIFYICHENNFFWKSHNSEDKKDFADRNSTSTNTTQNCSPKPKYAILGERLPMITLVTQILSSNFQELLLTFRSLLPLHIVDQTICGVFCLGFLELLTTSNLSLLMVKSTLTPITARHLKS